MPTRLLLLFALVLPLGCAPAGNPPAPSPAPPTPAAVAMPAIEDDPEVTAERDKLPPAERELVDAQEWCAVNSDERLGSMGPPIKLELKGQAVFLCCKGCKRAAEADPDAALAKVEELKAKKRAGGGT